jgi:hypothetical protein
MSKPPSDNRSRIVGGIILILLGLAQIISNNISGNGQAWLWIVAFAGSAAAFVWVYSQGKEGWAAVGAYVFGALALLLLLLTQFNLEGVLVPVLVLLAIALPFVYMWNRNRSQWGWLIPAYVLIAIIPVLFLGETAGDESTLVPAYVMAVIGAPFILAFLRLRQWPFLIPGGIMWLLAAFFLFDAAENGGAVVAVLLIVVGVVLLLGDRIGLKIPTKPKREG